MISVFIDAIIVKDSIILEGKGVDPSGSGLEVSVGNRCIIGCRVVPCINEGALHLFSWADVEPVDIVKIQGAAFAELISLLRVVTVVINIEAEEEAVIILKDVGRATTIIFRAGPGLFDFIDDFVAILSE